MESKITTRSHSRILLQTSNKYLKCNKANSGFFFFFFLFDIKITDFIFNFKFYSFCLVFLYVRRTYTYLYYYCALFYLCFYFSIVLFLFLIYQRSMMMSRFFPLQTHKTFFFLFHIIFYLHLIIFFFFRFFAYQCFRSVEINIQFCFSVSLFRWFFCFLQSRSRMYTKCYGDTQEIIALNQKTLYTFAYIYLSFNLTTDITANQ